MAHTPLHMRMHMLHMHMHTWHVHAHGHVLFYFHLYV